MQDEQMPKRLLYVKTSVRRTVRRPRSIRLEKVNTDALEMW
jgi:hypothetical protein